MSLTAWFIYFVLPLAFLPFGIIRLLIPKPNPFPPMPRLPKKEEKTP